MYVAKCEFPYTVDILFWPPQETSGDSITLYDIPQRVYVHVYLCAEEEIFLFVCMFLSDYEVMSSVARSDKLCWIINFKNKHLLREGWYYT